MIARNNFYSKLNFLLLCTLWRQNAKWISKKKVQQIILGLARLVSVYLGGQGYRLYPRFFILFRTFENYYFKCVQTCGTNHTSHPAALSPKITILYEKNLKKKLAKDFSKIRYQVKNESKYRMRAVTLSSSVHSHIAAIFMQ